MKHITKHIFTVTLLTGLSMASLHAEEPRQPRTHAKTRQGVTVTIEKVVLERILNEPAWIEAGVAGQEDPDHNDLRRKAYRQALPVKQLTCFISVAGETKVHGPVKVDLAEDQALPIASGAAFFSPPKWQPQVPNLIVDPEAGGIRAWLNLGAKVPLAKIFPVRIEVKVTSADGEVLTFEFENVKF